VARDRTPRFFDRLELLTIGVESCRLWTAVVESSNQL
jgi:hypothetical protein